MAEDKGEFPSGEDYGRSLRGFGINMLVRNVARSVAFAREVLLAEVATADQDFAVLRHRVDGRVLAEWMLHADGTYHSNPLPSLIAPDGPRGAGLELRLYAIDPDAAVVRARARSDVILAEPADKPHGMREAYILDPDGYCWVVSRPLSKNQG
ncbi:catechol 2,3-dioxygenase-like lactoylglutathione lyase family enzyme [Dongia mobilis]|uniref:Catechol 2,3-dioxygenase-like lactoylglutathione lyase family enzyme n=1 Tax=Dongia mobilis TaxID=578943 RepID=A0A4V3DE56_9PROT|nr:glyoxalase [Dongia mobilis]TDQ78825.1 catechol 2,3-dioxygenase-like lactoylglutathione lyase family enzyme [Dongia mobilis]